MTDFVRRPTGDPGYYVSAIDGPDRRLIAGPYADHADALARVERVKRVWEKRYNPRAAYWAWGTARVHPDGEPVPRSRRRVRLPLFEPQPSEGRFRIYARGSGHLTSRQAGELHPGRGWTELARVTLPRKMVTPEGFDWRVAACDALMRIYDL